MSKWSSEWPKEEGYYWYYGSPFGGSLHKAELILVKIYKEETTDCLLCVSFGSIVPLYQQEPNDMDGRPFGVFYHKKISFPRLPSQDFFDKTLKEKSVISQQKECRKVEFELRRAKREVQRLEGWLKEKGEEIGKES